MTRGIRVGAAALGCILALGAASLAHAVTIHNYEDSEALRQALAHSYKAESREMRDREKAVQYFEQYLTENPKTRNKARVLAAIGLLYLYDTDEKKGVLRDKEKAAVYLKKAIDADPDLICNELIQARTNLDVLGTSGEQRMMAEIATYRWLMDLTDQDLRNSVRRDTGWVAVASIRQEIARLRKLIAVYAESKATNIIADALDNEHPEEALGNALEALKGYPAEERVTAELAKIQAQAADCASN